MSEEGIKIDGREEIAELPELVQNAHIGMAHGLSGLALTMAMKYHDIGTVQDGTLYQQYKLEGKNLRELHLDIVLETAEKLERWLVGSPDRISKLMIAAIENADIVEEEDEIAAEGETP
jgi:hypothetical protein